MAKTLIRVLAAASVVAGLGITESAKANEAPQVEVNVSADISELAHGYATAFAQMSASRTKIYIRTEEGVQRIHYVREVRASGGVVIIETRDNNILVVDARRIVLMTDGKTEP